MLINIKKILLNLAKKYIVWYSRNTNIILHTKNELEFSKSNEIIMDDFIRRNIIECISLLYTQYDSRYKVNYDYQLDMINKLINFKLLSPLTFSDDEFEKTIPDLNARQNKRISSIFKYYDGTYSYTNGILLKKIYYVGEDNLVIENDGGIIIAPIFVLYPDGNIKCFYMDRIRDIMNFTLETMYVDCYSIEYPKDWWITLCSEQSFLKLNENYFFQIESPVRVNNELNFENGKHKIKILNRIETVGKHMYGDNFCINNYFL